MNWDAIGTISEIVGALVVVATLFYLARQIRQSNAQGRRSEIIATFRLFSIARMATAQNEGLADVFVRGSNSYADLTPIEKHRFENLMSERFWVFHSIWDGVQTNAFESYFWGVVEQQITELLKQPGIKEWWINYKIQFPSEYVREIDRQRTEDT
jgi:hypothetical protein